jgi:peptide deformylase
MTNINGIYQIRTLGDPCLNQKVSDVENFDSTLSDMIAIMRPFLSGNAIGLAANQVGIMKNFFVWKYNERVHEIINPRIVDWDGVADHHEGCLSLPDTFFAIRRAESVVIEGFNLKGKKVSHRGYDLEAAIFQHEVDHLNGMIALNSPNFIGVLDETNF